MELEFHELKDQKGGRLLLIFETVKYISPKGATVPFSLANLANIVHVTNTKI